MIKSSTVAGVFGAGALAICGAAIALAFPNPRSAGQRPPAVPLTAPTPPIANGDTFAYSIKETTKTTEPGKKPIINTYFESDTQSVTYPVTYETRKNVYKLTDNVTLTSGPQVDFEREYIGFVQSGATYNLLEYGADAIYYCGSTACDTETEVNGEPYDILAEYPESVGLQWPNNFSYKLTDSEQSGSYSETEKLDQLADGAYTESNTLNLGSGNYVFKYDLKSDGTGTYSSQYPGQQLARYVIGLPVQQGTKDVIPVTSDGMTVDVPDWYPGAGEPLSPLLDIEDSIPSLASTPTACGSQKGVTAYDVHETFYFLDPVGGDYQTGTSDHYDSPTLGTICVLVSQKLVAYDNITNGKVLDTQTYDDVQILTGEQLSPNHFGRTAALGGLDFRKKLREDWRLRRVGRFGAPRERF